MSPPLQFIILLAAGWVNRHQQDVIAYLKEEPNRVLREQLGDRRLRFSNDQRRRLAVKGKVLGSTRLHDVASLVTPDTILRWYRTLVAQKYDGSPHRGPGRPRTTGGVADVVVRIATENPTFGYTRIRDALSNLGHEVARNTVKRILVALAPILWAMLHVVKSAARTPGGILSDRVGRRPLIIGGWAVYAAVYLGFARATTAWEAWALFAAYGIYFGLTEGVEKALVADLSPVALRGSAFGVYHAVTGFGALGASLLFGAVWEWRGAEAAFLLGAVLALMAAGLLVAAVPAAGAGAGRT